MPKSSSRDEMEDADVLPLLPEEPPQLPVARHVHGMVAHAARGRFGHVTHRTRHLAIELIAVEQQEGSLHSS